jgi:hypothetical protein
MVGSDSQALIGNDGLHVSFHRVFHTHVTCNPKVKGAIVVAVLDCCRTQGSDSLDGVTADDIPPVRSSRLLMVVHWCKRRRVAR